MLEKKQELKNKFSLLEEKKDILGKTGEKYSLLKEDIENEIKIKQTYSLLEESKEKGEEDKIKTFLAILDNYLLNIDNKQDIV